jgi:hypothetical protein
MTQDELKRVAEESWESCDGCTETDKHMWINGFIRAANLFAEVGSLPSPDELEERGKLIGGMISTLLTDMKDLDPEFSKIIDENFWELTDNKPEEESPYCPICESCGVDGCCSPLNCHHHPDGHYCGSHLKDLKFGYVMYTWFYKNIYDALTPEQKAECDNAHGEAYDGIYEL